MHEMTVTSAKYAAEVDGSNSSNTVLAVIDGVTMNVPMDTANRHYQAILDWVADGNTIQDAS